MSARSAAAVAVNEFAKLGEGAVIAVAAAIVCPFDCVLSGMIRAGLGVEAICACLGLSRDILDYNLIRLDLPTPHDRPRRKAGRHAWKDDELRCAIYWRRLGIHQESIGFALGRSTPAVRSKLYRLGVPAPDRKSLHKVDPAVLNRTPPDFGFPCPPDQRAPGAVSSSDDIRGHKPYADSASDGTAPAYSTTAPVKREAATDGVEAGQGNLALPGTMPISASKPAQADFPELAEAEPLREQTAGSPLPEHKSNANSGHDKAQVVGPAELIRKFEVVGEVRRPDTNEAYLTWLTLLYLGGMHYKAMGAYLGRSASSVQAILSRMQIPRDTKRSNFGWSCDLECAVAKLEQWDFVWQRCTDKPDLAVSKRPLFWRHKKDTYNRRRRFSRLKNKEIDEHFKYKGGHTVEIMTRAQLEAQRRVDNANVAAQQPVRLQVSMQGCLPIQQGAAHEQFRPRGHAPSVRPGFSRNARDQMPWADPRNGCAAQPVAYP